jgi:hypothetical protein
LLLAAAAALPAQSADSRWRKAVVYESSFSTSGRSIDLAHLALPAYGAWVGEPR